MIKITILSLNPHRWNKESESETEREKLVRQGLATGNNRLRGFESWPTTSRSPSPSLPSPKTRMERLRERKWRKQTSPLSLSLSLSEEGKAGFHGDDFKWNARAYTGRRSEAILLIKRWGIDPNKLAIKPDESPRDRASTTFPANVSLCISLPFCAFPFLSLSLSLSVRAYTTT